MTPNRSTCSRINWFVIIRATITPWMPTSPLHWRMQTCQVKVGLLHRQQHTMRRRALFRPLHQATLSRSRIRPWLTKTWSSPNQAQSCAIQVATREFICPMSLPVPPTSQRIQPIMKAPVALTSKRIWINTIWFTTRLRKAISFIPERRPPTPGKFQTGRAMTGVRPSLQRPCRPSRHATFHRVLTQTWT